MVLAHPWICSFLKIVLSSILLVSRKWQFPIETDSYITYSVYDHVSMSVLIKQAMCHVLHLFCLRWSGNKHVVSKRKLVNAVLRFCVQYVHVMRSVFG